MSSGARGEEEKMVFETKVVILGHTGVGKTSMVNQYCRGQFLGNTQATIGAAFMKKTVVLNNWTVVLQIWDTAGQERFRSMAPMYYRGAHAAILVFDVSAPDTLEKVGGWIDELTGHANDDAVVVLAANKSDLRSTSTDCVSAAAAAAYAKQIGATIFETSAKTAKGIDEMFDFVAKTLLRLELDKRKAKDELAKAHGASALQSGGSAGAGHGDGGAAGGTIRLADGTVASGGDKGGGCCGGSK